MTLELIKMRYFADGGHEGFRHKAWAMLGITFQGKDDDGDPDVRVSIPLSIDPAQTFGAQREAFRDQALAILRQALALLETHSIAALDEIAAEIEARELEDPDHPSE